MSPRRLGFLLVLGFVIVTPVTIVIAGQAASLAAGHKLTLTIRNLACPVAYEGAAYAQDCQAPVVNLEFAITAPETHAQTAATDAAGTVAFDLPAGTYDVTGGPPGEFVQNAITCRTGADVAIPHPFLPRDNRAISVTLADTDITCDWYSIPFDLRGD